MGKKLFALMMAGGCFLSIAQAANAQYCGYERNRFYNQRDFDNEHWYRRFNEERREREFWPRREENRFFFRHERRF